jgi:hypothetical protein
MRCNLLALLLLLFLALPMKSQGDAAAKAESARLAGLNKTLDGTFQIQIVNSRELSYFPLAYLDVIAARRSATDTVYYTYPDKPNFRILILPSVVINNPNFVKPQRITYVAH